MVTPFHDPNKAKDGPDQIDFRVAKLSLPLNDITLPLTSAFSLVVIHPTMAPVGILARLKSLYSKGQGK